MAESSENYGLKGILCNFNITRDLHKAEAAGTVRPRTPAFPGPQPVQVAAAVAFFPLGAQLLSKTLWQGGDAAFSCPPHPSLCDRASVFHIKGFLVEYLPVLIVITPLSVPSPPAPRVMTAVTWAAALNCAEV